VEINSTTLEMIRQGNDDISPESLLWLNGQDLYAIHRNSDNLYLARFNMDLVLQARSSIAINPYASVLFSGNLVITQRADGSAVLLNARDLREAL
jgi:hypothetical protein